MACRPIVTRITHLAALLCAALALGTPWAARADVIYTYTGPAFTEFVGIYSCPSICGITGSFTLASALPDNLPATDITPVSYSFTDGVHVFDPTTVQRVFAFMIETDALGLPSRWDLTFQTNTAAAPPMRALGTVWGLGLERDISNQTAILDVQPGGSAACYNCAKGTWRISTTGTPVPEPSALVLLGAGLLGICARARSARSA